MSAADGAAQAPAADEVRPPSVVLEEIDHDLDRLKRLRADWLRHDEKFRSPEQRKARADNRARLIGELFLSKPLSASLVAAVLAWATKNGDYSVLFTPEYLAVDDIKVVAD